MLTTETDLNTTNLTNDVDKSTAKVDFISCSVEVNMIHDGASDLDNVDQETQSPGEDHAPGSSDGQAESVVEEVGVHQVQQPGDAGDQP